jgi:hypothetical protein
MSYDVGILYRDDMPEHLVLDLASDLREANAEVAIDKRPNEPVAMLEWLIPAIAFIITLPYIAKLQELAAEDHYPKIKASLSKFARKVLRIKQQTIVSSQSPNKVQEDSPVSSTFAVWTTTNDGRRLNSCLVKARMMIPMIEVLRRFSMRCNIMSKGNPTMPFRAKPISCQIQARKSI